MLRYLLIFISISALVIVNFYDRSSVFINCFLGYFTLLLITSERSAEKSANVPNPLEKAETIYRMFIQDFQKKNWNNMYKYCDKNMMSKIRNGIFNMKIGHIVSLTVDMIENNAEKYIMKVTCITHENKVILNQMTIINKKLDFFLNNMEDMK